MEFAMKVLLAAGGTAGHINPALAIAKQFALQGADVLFIGREGGMETELVTREGFAIKTIAVQGFRRSLSLHNFKVAHMAYKSIGVCKKIISDFEPDIVIGCGGYVSGPAVFAATRLKIPTLIHEQNVFPGLTTKLLSKRVTKVAVSFMETKNYLKTSNLILTGNPIRLPQETNRDRVKEKLGLDPSRQMVLIFGGSLGAGKINDCAMDLMRGGFTAADVVFAPGKRNYDDIMATIQNEKLDDGNFKIVPYIYNMDQMLTACDLAVCRAGAITISELCTYGRASILIPSPNVTHNHQEYNANAVKQEGAAEVILESNLDSDTFRMTLTRLLQNPQRIATMEKSVQNMAMPDATEKIYQQCMQMVK